MIRKSVAHYHVTEKLGEGGMGVVYRATDTKLNREVALKVLPEQFAKDAERMARFKREAQVLASLNHPNIAAIHGLAEEPGVLALVLELVEGPTLAERLRTGPLTLDETLAIARQIADALEAAHEKGVIHRDLKPANVKVTEEGTVKVLDFGLAKALEDPASGTDVANSPTLSIAATQAGVILGTAAYMSPEQAAGKKADRRCDIWSFGVVLWEMLTGTRLFTGETVSHILADVLKGEPDWDALPPETPPAVCRLLKRCLTRDRRNRLRDIGEARIAIEEYQNAPAEAAPAEGVSALPSPAPSGGRRILPWVVAGILAAGLAVALAALWQATRPIERTPMRLTVEVSPEAELVVDTGAAAVLSPDGTRLAFATQTGSDRMLYVRSLDSLDATPLPGTEGARQPFFSPDGQWVAFFTDSALKKVSITGGTLLTLAPAGSGGGARGGSWGEDDRIVFSAGTRVGLSIVAATGGTPAELTPLDTEKGERTHRWPHMLPGGKSALFMSHTANTNFDEGTIEAVGLESGKRKVLIQGGTYPHYLPTGLPRTESRGHLVYLREGTLFAVPFDSDRLEVTGTPAPVLEGVMENSTNGGGQIAFSQTGMAIYLSGEGAGEVGTVVWVNRQGRTQPLVGALAEYDSPRLSPNGKRLAVDIIGGTSSDVWIYDLERGARTRLTFDAALDMMPVWTPDGRYVTFTSDREGNLDIFWKRADGAGEAVRLTQNPEGEIPASWSPDGRVLLYEVSSRDTLWDLWTLRLDDDDLSKAKPGTPEVFLQTPFSEESARFSPDGRWIAYQSNESGPWEVYVRPFPGPGGRWQVSTSGGRKPLWSRDKRELFYRNGNREMVVRYNVDGDSFRAETPQLMFEGRFMDLGRFYARDVAPDGKRFVMLQSSVTEGEPADLTKVTLVLNFFDELRRSLPAN